MIYKIKISFRPLLDRRVTKQFSLATGTIALEADSEEEATEYVDYNLFGARPKSKYKILSIKGMKPKSKKPKP